MTTRPTPDLKTGTADELDEQLDRVMTNAPDTVQLLESFITGRTIHDGYWDSDHARVFSALRIR